MKLVRAVVVLVAATLLFAGTVYAQDATPASTDAPKPSAVEPAKPNPDVQQLQQQVKEQASQIQQLAALNQKAPAEQLKALQDQLTATLKAAYDQASAGCKALGAKEMTLAITDGKPNFSCVVKVK